MITRRSMPTRARVMIAVLCVVAAVALAAQIWWGRTAMQLVATVDPEPVGELARLEARLDQLEAVLDQAWFLGDLAMVEHAASSFVTDVRHLHDVVSAGTTIETRPQLAEIDRGLDHIEGLLRGDDGGAPTYREVRAALVDLRVPTAAVLDEAYAAADASVGALRQHLWVAAMGSLAMILIVVSGAVWLGFVLRGLIRRHERRMRASRNARLRVRHEAEHDSLTGLANRRLLQRSLVRRFASAQTSGRSFALHLLDLDDLKSINDKFGHPAGDVILQAVARSLESTVRRCDIVARLGGDEFAVLQADANPRTAAVMARRLQERLRHPVRVEDGMILVPSASVGTAVYGVDGVKQEDMVRAADQALYRAKSNDKGTWRPVRAVASASA